MKPHFFIEISALESLENKTICSWYKQELTQTSSGTDDLETIKTKTQACEVVLVLSGLDVLSRTVELELKNRKQLAQALAYELEEQLATEVENLFFAYQNSEEKGFLDVAIVNKQWFEGILGFFTQLELELTAVVSDLSILKACKLDWVLLQKNHHFLLKTPSMEYALDTENLSYFLKHLPEPLPEKITFICKDDFQLKNFDIDLNHLQKQSSAFGFLSASYQVKQSLNLLQGSYKPKAKHSWKIAQYLVIAVFILLCVLTGVESYQRQQLQQENQQLVQQRIGIYKRNFPNSKRIFDPLAQMRNQVAALKMNGQKTAGLIPLLAKLAQAARLPLQQQNVNIEKIEFQNTRLKLNFNAKSYGLAEQFKAQLEQQQLKVEQNSFQNKDNQAKLSYTLSE